MKNILHSSVTAEWGTPTYIIDAVVNTFDKQIDFDPCSCEKANKLVKAKKFLTQEQDGLSTKWFDSPKSVFINPPSGKLLGVGKTKLFWQELIDYYEEGLLEQAIFLGFSVEQLAILQDCTYDPLDFSFCIPRKRIPFANLIDPSKGRSPTHSNFLCYIPGTIDNKHLFYKYFSPLGKVIL